MEQAETDLLTAFRQDHRLLGQGFYELSRCLRSRNLAAARSVAARLDEEAGAHIAFEEAHYYPRLTTLLREDDVRRLYAEHSLGLGVIERLCGLPSDGQLTEQERERLLQQSERMESHIAECGELFEALGRIPRQEQDTLCRALLRWRQKRPTWRHFAHAHGMQQSDR